MGGAIGMSVPLLEVQMEATYCDDGQATWIISQVMQVFVLWGFDLLCTGLRTKAMLGYWRKNQLEFQAVLANN